MKVYGERPSLERCIEKASRHIGGMKAAREAQYAPQLLRHEPIYHDGAYLVRVMTVLAPGGEVLGAISTMRSGKLYWHQYGLTREGQLVDDAESAIAKGEAR